MPVLDAALAFALTMLIIATIVSQIVSFFQRMLKIRHEQFKKMLEDYIDNEIQPVIKRELSKVEGNLKGEIKTDAIQKVVEAGDKLIKTLKGKKEGLTTEVSLSTDELIETIKRTDAGDQLLKKLGDQADKLFDEMGKRYEYIGDKFTGIFREKSRKVSTVLALILALALNIDSIHIAHSYLMNESMRADVIANMGEIMDTYEDAVSSVDNDADFNTKEELKEALNETKGQIELLTGFGMPVGWTQFPHVGFSDKDSVEFSTRDNFIGWVLWILGVILTAVFAGLGAPFWYDTVSGINKFVQYTKKKKSAASTQK